MCYISFPHPQSLSALFFSPEPLLSHGGATVFIHFSQVHPQTCPSRTDPSESWFHCSTAVAQWVDSSLELCPKHIIVGLAASLQKHVEGVHHAFAQVGGAARRQQGAEFEGFGDAVLVYVCQHVLIPLATQDDLGVVMVKIDLRR